MGTIEKRGRGSWRVGLQVETPAGWQWVRETVHVDPLLSESAQRKLAKKALARLETEVEAGEKGPPGYHYTVRTFSELWLESEVKPNCSPVTYANYKYLIESRIVPLLGDVGLTRLTPVILTQWLAQLRASPRKSTRLPDDRLTHKRPPSRQPRPDQDRPLSVKTLQNYYSCLDTMLDAAVRLNVLKENPMAKVTRPSGRKKRACFLSEERALELLRALADEPNVSYRCALLLALLCGLRLGEVGELKLSDIDFERRTIDISRALKYTPEEGSFVDAPKTDAGMRVISLPEGMMTVLESARAYQEARSAPLEGRGLAGPRLGRQAAAPRHALQVVPALRRRPRLRGRHLPPPPAHPRLDPPGQQHRRGGRLVQDGPLGPIGHAAHLRPRHSPP